MKESKWISGAKEQLDGQNFAVKCVEAGRFFYKLFVDCNECFIFSACHHSLVIKNGEGISRNGNKLSCKDNTKELR